MVLINFQRQWDGNPKVWDSWEEEGIKWTVEDLHPEDHDKAMNILIKYQLPEEALSVNCGVPNDPVALEIMCKSWKMFMDLHMSLGCYREGEGSKELAALNVCYVKSIDDELGPLEFDSKAWLDTLGVVKYSESKFDTFKQLNTDRFLSALGLVVKQEYRGARLGSRILNAREPLCKFLDVKATSTLFTGVASQKSAERCGFQTGVEIPFRELADAGFPFPRDENKSMKIMYKIYK